MTIRRPYRWRVYRDKDPKFPYWYVDRPNGTPYGTYATLAEAFEAASEGPARDLTRDRSLPWR